jgi:DNA primase
LKTARVQPDWTYAVSQDFGRRNTLFGMLTNINSPRLRAERYHRFLPEAIRDDLKGRGIPGTLIEEHQLGWNGDRITIPVRSREGEVLGFRYAKSPTDISDTPKLTSDPSIEAELYGREILGKNPRRVVIADNEFSCLVLEANGFAAVSAIAGAGVFLPEWVPLFDVVKHVYVCFTRDADGAAAAKQVQALLPRARIVKLPPGTRDVADFFVSEGKTRLDFEILLAAAATDSDDPADTPPAVREFRPHDKSVRKRAERLRKAVKLHEVVDQFTTLEACGKRLVGHCPFHTHLQQSFSVYPEVNTYACSVCGVTGDVLKFLMDHESMTLGAALEALEGFQFTHELYGTG